VTYQFDRDIDCRPQKEPERRPRVLPTALTAGGLALLASSRLSPRAYSVSSYSTFASEKWSVEAADKAVGLKDFQAFQQQVVGQMQSTAQLLAAQQAETKRLVDQVSALAAKIEADRAAPASAQIALPATPSVRKKPAAPKPAAGISTGGAPLPPPVQLTR